MYTAAKSIVLQLQKEGYTAYFAGGWVRDHLLNIPSDDIDIATNAPTQVLQKMFKKTIPVGLAFGIIIVVIDNRPFEVATFRKESGYTDGRHPSHVEPATPQEDAQRRDFTINGMFYDPIEEKVIDYVEGKKDLSQGIIRAIGDPKKRFMEDKLRLIRAARLSNRFHFPIEEKTKEAILHYAHDLFPSVAIERVVQELKKMKNLKTGLLLLHKLQLLQEIFPSLKDVPTKELHSFLEPLGLYPKKAPFSAQILPLFPHTPLEELLKLAKNLKLSSQEIDFISFLHHGKELIKNGGSDWQWAHYYADDRSTIALQIIAAHQENRKDFLLEHQTKKQKLYLYIKNIQKKTPIVTSFMLMDLHIPPGKVLGKLLQEAEKIAINQKIHDPKIIVEILQKSSLWPTKDA